MEQERSNMTNSTNREQSSVSKKLSKTSLVTKTTSQTSVIGSLITKVGFQNVVWSLIGQIDFSNRDWSLEMVEINVQNR